MDTLPTQKEKKSHKLFPLHTIVSFIKTIKYRNKIYLGCTTIEPFKRACVMSKASFLALPDLTPNPLHVDI